MKRQMRALGLGHDPRRGPSTTDVDYYRWTQWIFLRLFDSWYDEEVQRARPVGELVEEFRRGRFETPFGLPFDDLGPLEQRELIDESRVGTYHCFTQAVRQAFLMGDGRFEPRDFSHRQRWVRDRIEALSSVFAAQLPVTPGITPVTLKSAT